MLPRASRRRRLAFLLILLACLAAAEGLARILPAPSQVNPHYLEISQDFEELDGLLESNRGTSETPRYYEEFLYAAAPVSTPHVNFTDYYSARHTPSSAPLSEARTVVWAFGGSTMENQETTDRLSIANTWARIFNQELGPTHVKNFGSGAFFSSLELIKFQKLLREVPEAELPDMAIFYDGYNDANNGFQYGPGRMQADLSQKLRSLIEHRYPALAAYSLSRALARYSRLWERTGSRVVDALLYPLPPPGGEEESLDGAVRVYTANVRMLEASCAAFQVECFFVLQPLLLTKQPLVGAEHEVLRKIEEHPRFGSEGVRFVRRFYRRVARELQANARFIDASGSLDGRTEPDFYDLGHVAADTPPVIGEATARSILARREQLAQGSAVPRARADSSGSAPSP